MGNEFGFAAPANVYDCTDGAVYLGVLLDDHWKILAPIIGEPELAEHPTFATRDERAANRDVCNMMVSEWAKQLPREQVLKKLQTAGLPAAPVNTFPEAAKDPHVQERDMLQPIEFSNGVTMPITGPAAKFSRTPTKVRSAAPDIGQHNEEILTKIGMTTD